MSKVFTITEGLENMGAIRTGGQGSVYKGRRVGEIITAIKLLPTPIFSQSEEDKHYRDFSSEVKKLQRVNENPNPNIVKIISFGISETGGFPFIEMEFIDGPDVGELVKPPYDPIFTVKEVIKVADHLSHALAHCHQLDVRHGDIKSNNVKYNKHTGNYVLLDFGLAILSDEERRTSLRRAGAIEFMAPEQNEGKMFYETDVYSFGIILYELLTGRVPFPLDGNSETARNKVMVAHMETAPPDILSLRASLMPQDWTKEKKALEMQVPDWLIKMTCKCLEKSPEARFRNGMELHDYISHHRIYTAEVAGIVKNKDHKWQAVIAEKDYEVQDLKAIVSKQEKEMQLLRNRTSVAATGEVPTRGKTVSRAAFNAVLIALLLVAGLAVYSLFFGRSVVGAANQEASTSPVEDSLDNFTGQGGSVVSESSGAAKSESREEKKKRRQDTVSVVKVPPVINARKKTVEKPDADAVVKEKEPEQREPTGQDEEVAVNNDPVENSDVRYKVRNKAHFHNQPDAGSKRAAFIVHWNNAVLKPLEEKNGFVYVVFTNHLGQVSKGWLAKSDLLEIK